MGGKRHGGQKTGGQKAGGQKAWGAKDRGAKDRGAKDRGANDRGAKDRGAKVLEPAWMHSQLGFVTNCKWQISHNPVALDVCPHLICSFQRFTYVTN